MVVSLTGKDTISINGRVLNDLADGDVALLDFPNELTHSKTGKNGNTIYGFDYTGRQCTLTLRLIRASADDKFVNQLLSLYKNDPSLFTLISGVLVKNVGDGSGNLNSDIYTLSRGVFKKETGAKENADGDTEQAVAIYTLLFSNAPRSIG